MHHLPLTYQQTIFNTIAGKITTPDFETWLYAHPELEGYIGPERYLSLISFRFKTDSRYNLIKILEAVIDMGEYETHKLLSRLKEAQTLIPGLPELLELFYYQYCDGYYFLQKVALGQGLSVVIHKENGNAEFEITPASFEELQTDIAQVIQWIAEKKIVLTGTRDNLNRLEYIDQREPYDRE
ncbi:hypothetical protein [Chitinophaga sp.]|uniref:hypothetical protein n=1 Tax=Chitinophaga sp. TaxID=1869181 RepID=UPI0031E06437